MVGEEVTANVLDSKFYCIQDEIMLVGCYYANPDLYWQYNKLKPEDLYDEAAKFYFQLFIELRMKYPDGFCEEVDIVTFATQNPSTFTMFTKYNGYSRIKQWIQIGHLENFKSYYANVKKYAFVREFLRKGFPVEKIVDKKEFKKMTAMDVYRAIMYQASRVNTDIMNDDETAVINSRMTDTAKKYLLKPQMGIRTPWEGYDLLFRGCRLGKVIFDGMLSNEGKTRKMMQLAAHITLVEDKPFLLMSNEMDEEDLRSCFFVTVLNNPEFIPYHGIDIVKPEREFVMGVYYNDDGEMITRKIDEFGDYEETDEEYEQRVYETSSEYRKVLKVCDWVDRGRNKNLYFKDVGLDYSDNQLDMEIKKHKQVYGVEYFGYDTLKGYGVDDWQTVKQTATKLKELCKNEHVFLYAVFQMTDDSINCEVFDLTSNNIANAKQIKHVADILVLNMKIKPEYYKKYERISFEDQTGKQLQTRWDLDKNKVYYGTKIDKNRAADKSKLLLFEVDLNLNTWKNVGYLQRKE